MEYVSGGDMFEYVVRKGGLKESEARWFFQQLIIGVDYLHRMVSFVLACMNSICALQGKASLLALSTEDCCYLTGCC